MGRLRQAVRNPSVAQVLLAALFVLAVTAAIFGPTVYRGASKGFAEINERRASPAIAPAPGTWINPWLRERAGVMMNATLPVQWRVADFKSGPCGPENLALLPADKWSAAIATACGQLDGIQQRYALSCAVTSSCAVPDEARRELQGVVDYLVAEYADAGLVVPYTTEESD